MPPAETRRGRIFQAEQQRFLNFFFFLLRVFLVVSSVGQLSHSMLRKILRVAMIFHEFRKLRLLFRGNTTTIEPARCSPRIIATTEPPLERRKHRSARGWHRAPAIPRIASNSSVNSLVSLTGVDLFFPNRDILGPLRRQMLPRKHVDEGSRGEKEHRNRLLFTLATETRATLTLYAFLRSLFLAFVSHREISRGKIETEMLYPLRE